MFTPFLLVSADRSRSIRIEAYDLQSAERVARRLFGKGSTARAL